MSTDVVQGVRYGLIGGGGLAAVALALLAWRRGLRSVLPRAAPAAGPTLLHASALMLAFFLLLQFAVQLVVAGYGAKAVSQAGSHAFHVLHACDAGVKIGLSVVMAMMLHRHSGFNFERLRQSPVVLIGAGLLGGFVMTSVVEALLWISQHLVQLWRPDVPHPDHPILIALKSSAWGRWGVVQLVLAAVVVAPIAEELFFRGVLLSALRPCFHSGWPAVLISSLAFGFVHAAAQPQAVLPLTAMGLALVYLRLRYASLAPCMVLHAYFNAQNVALVLLCPDLVRS
ncbi:CAAX amino terminal protease self- immunity [Phycisphaerae bacterium RAS1]|nr:CAAX amino terminal protease self- immunity [Phycisphaerae bacterium RAS1]